MSLDELADHILVVAERDFTPQVVEFASSSSTTILGIYHNDIPSTSITLDAGSPLLQGGLIIGYLNGGVGPPTVLHRYRVQAGVNVEKIMSVSTTNAMNQLPGMVNHTASSSSARKYRSRAVDLTTTYGPRSLTLDF